MCLNITLQGVDKLGKSFHPSKTHLKSSIILLPAVQGPLLVFQDVFC